MVDRIQCMRDVIAAHDYKLDILIDSRDTCMQQYLTGFDFVGADGAEGHYNYIGTLSNGSRVYAKSDSASVEIVSGVLYGDGTIFTVMNMGTGMVYILAYSGEWSTTSPTTYYMSNGGPSNANAALVPQPPDCEGWAEIDVTPIDPVFTNLSYT